MALPPPASPVGGGMAERWQLGNGAACAPAPRLDSFGDREGHRQGARPAAAVPDGQQQAQELEQGAASSGCWYLDSSSLDGLDAHVQEGGVCVDRPTCQGPFQNRASPPDGLMGQGRYPEGRPLDGVT